MPEDVGPLAGKPAPRSLLVNVPRLMTAYCALSPDPAIVAQRVTFGTSGHRGSAFAAAFNEAHILAIGQAVCLYRRYAGIDGPLFLGMDTHALSEAAFATALEVLAGNGVETMIDEHGGYTPTPVISHAILSYNRGRKTGLADGIVISPSHNPPDEGGFKYNPPNGGPADVDMTRWIETTANNLLVEKLDGVVRVPYGRATKAACIHRHDYIGPYVADLTNVVDMEAIRAAGVRIGIDPLGGAAIQYWQPMIERYKIAATVVNDAIDPAFRFMTVDWDGKIRMDCSSPYAMTPLVALRDKFDIAFANDTDADRHGIVCPSGGLMNPNYYLAAAISYLCSNRPEWRRDCAIGKTVVSSGMIDRVVSKVARRLVEVPVGFKWFSSGLIDGSLGFGGEESAGASFLRRDGSVWTTDKDGLIMGLLGVTPWSDPSVKLAFGPFWKDGEMARKRHKPEEMVAKLRQVDVLTGQGMSVAEAVKTIAVTETTYFRWRAEYGGMKTDQVKRLKELEIENARLRRAVSDLTLDKLILAEAARGN